MRKSAFIFAVFYLLSVVGYGLEVHYCLGVVTDVNVAWLDTSCVCEESPEHISHKCCDEKSFFVQLNEEHQATFSASFDKQPSQSGNLVWTTHKLVMERNPAPSVFLDRGPPNEEHKYQKHCALIFYG